MSVSPARACAFDILREVEQRDSFAVDLLHSRRTAELSSVDAALCTQIVMGVLRWQSALDAEIARASDSKKLDAEVRIALRIGLFQVRHLSRVPERAAVNESVELVKRARKRSAAPFANAVLRKLASAKPYEAGSVAERWAHPPWMVDRWVEQYGAAAAEAICRADQETPPTTLRLPLRETEAIERELEAAGVRLAPGRLVANARTVLSGDVTQTAAYREGRVAIQDEGAQLVAKLVGEGKRILDCCAAPGGKTAAMADRNPEARITAVELHEHRVRLMRKMVKAANVEFLQADAATLPGHQEYDRVLADVPCSGTGTLARNPEIKWRLRPADLQELHARQVAILRAGLAKLGAGGRLVYSTCSLEAEENQQVVEAALSDGFESVDCRSEVDESLCAGPFLRTVPGVHPCDGFFAALVKRVG